MTDKQANDSEGEQVKIYDREVRRREADAEFKRLKDSGLVFTWR